jgi:Tfp pilus assembly protein PilO
MKLQLSPREQKTLLSVAGLGVVILWVYIAAIVRPLMREVGQLNQQRREAREQLKLLEASTANETTLQGQYRQLEQNVLSLRKLLPSEEELPAVIELVSDMASQAQVKIQTIFPQRPVGSEGAGKSAREKDAVLKQPAGYKEVLIQIDALAGFHQLGTFLSLVEQGDKPMQIANLHVTQDPKETKRLRIKLRLQSYFAPSEGRAGGASTAPQAADRL